MNQNRARNCILENIVRERKESKKREVILYILEHVHSKVRNRCPQPFRRNIKQKAAAILKVVVSCKRVWKCFLKGIINFP